MKYFRVFIVSVLCALTLVSCSTFKDWFSFSDASVEEVIEEPMEEIVEEDSSYEKPEAYVDGNVVYVVAQKLSGNTASFSYPDFVEKELVNDVYLYLYGKHLDIFEGSSFIIKDKGYSEFTVGMDVTDEEFEAFLEQIKIEINEYLADLWAEPEPVPEPEPVIVYVEKEPEPVPAPEPVIVYVEKEPEPEPEPEPEKPGPFAYVIFALILVLGAAICVYCLNMRKKEEQAEGDVESVEPVEQPSDQSSDKPLLN